MYIKPLSYSAIQLYHECPHKWADSYVHGNWTKHGGVQADRGNDFHKALENYFKGAMYPSGEKKLATWRPFMEGLKDRGLVAEGEIAVDAEWRPVGYRDPSANFRGKIDGLLEAESHLYDWKTGKFYEYHIDQARAYTATRTLPEDGWYSASFVYLDIPLYVQTWKFSRQEMQDVRGDISERIRVIRADEEWAPRPSEKNCKWCKLDWRKGGSCSYAP